MKEYRVINYKRSLTGNNQKLEDTLNENARNGWTLKHIGETSARIVFERNKNR